MRVGGFGVARGDLLLVDMFGLYLKTKNFHWHVPGLHFGDYHLLLDEQGDQILGRTLLPSGYVKSAATRCGRSATSIACHASRRASAFCTVHGYAPKLNENDASHAGSPQAPRRCR
jgi:hypothetical protein